EPTPSRVHDDALDRDEDDLVLALALEDLLVERARAGAEVSAARLPRDERHVEEQREGEPDRREDGERAEAAPARARGRGRHGGRDAAHADLVVHDRDLTRGDSPPRWRAKASHRRSLT